MQCSAFWRKHCPVTATWIFRWAGSWGNVAVRAHFTDHINVACTIRIAIDFATVWNCNLCARASLPISARPRCAILRAFVAVTSSAKGRAALHGLQHDRQRKATHRSARRGNISVQPAQHRAHRKRTALSGQSSPGVHLRHAACVQEAAGQRCTGTMGPWRSMHGCCMHQHTDWSMHACRRTTRRSLSAPWPTPTAKASRRGMRRSVRCCRSWCGDAWAWGGGRGFTQMRPRSCVWAACRSEGGLVCQQV